MKSIRSITSPRFLAIAACCKGVKGVEGVDRYCSALRYSGMLQVSPCTKNMVIACDDNFANAHGWGLHALACSPSAVARMGDFLSIHAALQRSPCSPSAVARMGDFLSIHAALQRSPWSSLRVHGGCSPAVTAISAFSFGGCRHAAFNGPPPYPPSVAMWPRLSSF